MNNGLSPRRAGYRRYLALGLITLILTVSTADRATLAIAGPSLSAELGITPIRLGWLFSAFAWTYVLGQIPAGWVVDRVGAKWTMLGGLIGWSAVTIATSDVGVAASPFIALAVLRLLLGLFESPVGPASGRIIAAWFPSVERGLAGSVFNGAQYLSLLLFLPLMGWLNHRFGWHDVFSVMGGLGLLTALVWFQMFHLPRQDRKVSKLEICYIESGGALIDLDAGASSDEGRPARERALGFLSIRKLFESRMLVGIFLGQYCINAITWFFVSWFPSYLVNGLGVSILTAGLMAVLPALLGWIGSLSSGIFSDYLLRRIGSLSLARKIPITIGLLISCVIITCNYIHSEWLIVVVMSFALFGKGFGGALVWTVIADTAPREMVGLTGGVANSFANVAGIVTPVVIGYILGSTKSFNGVLLFVGAHSVGALICYWFVVGPIQRLEIDDFRTARLQ